MEGSNDVFRFNGCNIGWQDSRNDINMLISALIYLHFEFFEGLFGIDFFVGC
jgi:hypothetical protein